MTIFEEIWGKKWEGNIISLKEKGKYSFHLSSLSLLLLTFYDFSFLFIAPILWAGKKKGIFPLHILYYVVFYIVVSEQHPSFTRDFRKHVKKLVLLFFLSMKSFFNNFLSYFLHNAWDTYFVSCQCCPKRQRHFSKAALFCSTAWIELTNLFLWLMC